MRSTGAEVVKLAIEAPTTVRCARRCSISPAAPDPRRSDSGSGHVLIAMGQAGVPTRVLAARLAQPLDLRRRRRRAGPDARVDGCCGEFRFRRITRDAALYGVVGNPDRPLAVAGHAQRRLRGAGTERGVRAASRPRDADDFVAFARAVGLRGASITAPFKVAMIGAGATTIDAAGQARRRRQHARRPRGPLDRRQHRRRRVPGAARRAAWTLERRARLGARRRRGGARAWPWRCRRRRARRSRSARAGAEAAGAIARPRRRRRRHVAAARRAAGTCSSTPRRAAAEDPGRRPDRPASRSTARSCSTWSTPRPRRRCSRDARAAGCLTIGGLEMLVAQAERQFELWTGQRPPAGLFEAQRRHGARRVDHRQHGGLTAS